MVKLVELERKLTDISGVSITLGTPVVAMDLHIVIVIQITTIKNMGVILQQKISFNLISRKIVLIMISMGMKIVTDNQVIMVCQEIHGHLEFEEMFDNNN